MASRGGINALKQANAQCKNIRPVFLLVALSCCMASCSGPSWSVYPLQRNQPHDGLAVVNQPDGYGLHIFLETDLSDPAICTPRWLPNPARLFNGNGTAPFSSGLASREEFFAVVARGDVHRALKRELKALCRQRSSTASWQWQEPPRSAEQVKPLRLPALEEEDVLRDPEIEMELQEELLKNHQPES